MLVDTGFGDETPQLGRLLPNLASVGVDPAGIDAILMTHMHPDHEAGLVDASGRAVFPNAELVVHEDDVAFWQDEAGLCAGHPDGAALFPARPKLRSRPTAAGSRRLRGGQEPVPGSWWCRHRAIRRATPHGMSVRVRTLF